MSIRKGNDIIASKPLVDAVPTQDSTNAVSSGGVYDVIQKITRGGFYHPDMFDWKWADHQLNDVQWLRADTFSWQSGSVYEAAFNELFYDIQISTYWYSSGGPGYTKSRTPVVGDAVYLNSDLTTQIGTVDSYDDVNDEITVSGDTYSYMSNTYVTPTTETVAGYSLSVYTGHSGRKIVSAGDETKVANIYTATGVAWYYIIDIPNKRFKLPRTKFGVTGLRDNVGDYVKPELPNITGTFRATLNSAYDADDTGAFTRGTNLGAQVTSLKDSYTYRNYEHTLNASDSNSIYKDDATVQPPATQMYLYFYVGNFTQGALENTAGINAEDFNDKADVDAQNFNATGREYLAGLAMPSQTFTDLTLGASGTSYTAPADGYVHLSKDAGSNWYYVSISVGYTSGGVDTTLYTAFDSTYSTSPCNVLVPIKKGNWFYVTYNATGTTNRFRFIYAQGAA